MKDDDKALVPVQQGIVAAVNRQLAITEKLLAHRRGRHLTNSIGMKFVLIPAGTFMMGSPEDEEGRRPNEVLHQVTLSRPFYIQTTQVTQIQWQLIMANNPSFSQEEALDQYGSSEDCPVETVS